MEGLKGSKSKQLIFQFLPSRAYLFGVQSSSHITAAYVHIFCGVWKKCPRKGKKKKKHKKCKIYNIKNIFPKTMVWLLLGCYWQITQRLLSKRWGEGRKKQRESAEIFKGLSVSGDIFYSKFFQVMEPIISFCSFIKNFFVIHLVFLATKYRQIATANNYTLCLSLYSVLQCISDYGNNTFFAPCFGYYLSWTAFINNIFSRFNKRLELH